MEEPVYKRGWFVILAIAAAGSALFFFGYVRGVPDKWFRDFAADIAARATIIEDAEPSGSAFPSMRDRPDPDHPYICFGKFPPMDWDRLYVIAPETDLASDPKWSGLDWPTDDLSTYSRVMLGDPRQQLFVLVKEGVVVSAKPFFTMWGDATALITDDGFTPSTAVFTADSAGLNFVLYPASDPPDGICD